MSRDVEQFAEATGKFSSIESHEEGPYLHEYDAILKESADSVRVITLAPELADNDAASDAFSAVSGQWYNANTHPNIVSILERETAPRPWIAIDQPHGLVLAQVQSQLTPIEIEQVVTATAEALRTLTLYNAVHGTLTPGDIIVLPNGDDTTVQVGGIGLEPAIQTALGAFDPTPYTAPELLDNPEQPTAQTDVYGLGAITYYALTGQPPVDGDTREQAIREGPTVPPSKYDEKIPPALDEVIMRALSASPGDRQDSPYAFKRAFISVYESSPADADVDGDDESAAAGIAQSADTAEVDQPDDTVGADASPPASAARDAKDPRSGVSRRAALSFLGLGAVGGAGAFLIGDQLTGPDSTEDTAPGTETASVETSDRTVWTFAADDKVRSSPAVVDTTLYVGDQGGAVNAVDITDGSRRWVFETDGSVRSSPTVVDNTVYIGSQDGHLYALDAGDGTAKWSFQTPDRIDTSPAVDDRTVYIGSDDGSLYALDADTGTEEWSFTGEDDMAAAPAVGTDTVYSGSEDANVYAVDAATGTRRWSFETDGPVDQPAAIGASRLFVGGKDGNVYALDIDTGDELWRYETGGEVKSRPAVVGDTVYIGSRDTNLYALDTRDGTLEWQFQTEGDVTAAPVVLANTVFVCSQAGSIHALTAAEGTPQWRHDQTNAIVHSSPAVVNNILYVGNDNGRVLAIEADLSTDETWRMFQYDQQNSGNPNTSVE